VAQPGLIQRCPPADAYHRAVDQLASGGIFRGEIQQGKPSPASLPAGTAPGRSQSNGAVEVIACPTSRQPLIELQPEPVGQGAQHPRSSPGQPPTAVCAIDPEVRASTG